MLQNRCSLKWRLSERICKARCFKPGVLLLKGWVLCISLFSQSGFWSTKSWTTKSWSTNSWTTKSWPTTNWTTKSWSTKNRTIKSWLTKSWTTESWSIKSWTTKSWLTRSWTVQSWSTSLVSVGTNKKGDNCCVRKWIILSYRNVFCIV